jgi:hypothetical protein
VLSHIFLSFNINNMQGPVIRRGIILVYILFFTLHIQAQKNTSSGAESVTEQKVMTITNGSWEKLNTEPYPGKQDDICFVNEQLGWYVNGYGKIYHTADGGVTWNKQLEQKGTFFRCIAFLDSLTGFAGTVGTDYFPNITDTIPLYKTRGRG